MGAPKKPNTAPATAAVVRRGHETMARKLRAAGWTVTEPGAMAKCRLCGFGYIISELTDGRCPDCGSRHDYARAPHALPHRIGTNEPVQEET